jgi:hypothetical protein
MNLRQLWKIKINSAMILIRLGEEGYWQRRCEATVFRTGGRFEQSDADTSEIRLLKGAHCY